MHALELIESSMSRAEFFSSGAAMCSQHDRSEKLNTKHHLLTYLLSAGGWLVFVSCQRVVFLSKEVSGVVISDLTLLSLV